MVQYLVLLLGNLASRVGEAVDAGFANSLSIGTICVFAILGSIYNLLTAFIEYGMYYYRMFGIKAKAGLFINIAIAVCASVMFISCSGIVKYVFYIEPEYEDLLSNCLLVSFIFFPFSSATKYLREYTTYSGKERLTTVSIIIYYIFLIGLDAIAVIKYSSAEYVLIGTGVCDMVNAIALYFISGISKDKFIFGDVIVVLKDGFPMFYNRLLSKVSILLINIFGSRLGTVEYAIISVSRKSLEVAQTCVQPILPMLIVKFRGSLRIGYKKIFDAIRVVTPISFLMFCAIGMLSLFMVKGDLTISQVLVATIISEVTSLITFYVYVILECRCTIQNNRSIIKGSGTVRLFITIIICLLSLIPFVSYWTILLYSTLTDCFVSVYMFVRLRKDDLEYVRDKRC